MHTERKRLFLRDITITQCHALVEIGRAKTISLYELAELLYPKDITMSRAVNNLVTGGSAKSVIATQDRRYITVSLTENG